MYRFIIAAAAALTFATAAVAAPTCATGYTPCGESCLPPGRACHDPGPQQNGCPSGEEPCNGACQTISVVCRPHVAPPLACNPRIEKLCNDRCVPIREFCPRPR